MTLNFQLYMVRIILLAAIRLSQIFLEKSSFMPSLPKPKATIKDFLSVQKLHIRWTLISIHLNWAKLFLQKQTYDFFCWLFMLCVGNWSGLLRTEKILGFGNVYVPKQNWYWTINKFSYCFIYLYNLVIVLFIFLLIIFYIHLIFLINQAYS